MLRSLLVWLLAAGLALAAYDAGTGGPRPAAGAPQTMVLEGGTGWPTPMAPPTVPPRVR